MTTTFQPPDATLNGRPPATAASPRLHFVHLPTPGDHYSPATGSAVITIIHELAKAHAAQNLPTSIIVANGTTDGFPPYSTGTLLETDLPLALPSKPKRILDSVLARLLLSRPFSSSQFANAATALTPAFGGTLFVHNAPAAIPLLRNKLPNARLVLYAHNQLFNTYSRREVRHIIDRADLILCVSNFISNDLARRAGLAPPKIQTLHNGIDTEMFTPAKRPPAGPPTVLFLGRMLLEKGPDLLLKAAATIASPARPFRLLLVGSTNFDPRAPLSPYEQQLRVLANHPSLESRVTFMPFVPRSEVPDLYRGASLFVAPSNWDEPFGLTIAEALASGLPTIASNRGGIPEATGDAALLFNPADPSQLAAHLASLLDDASLRSRYASAARARALKLSWQNQYLRLTELLPQ